MGLTVLPEPDGAFTLATDAGDVVGCGRAFASETVPGHVTLVLEHLPSGSAPRVLRVPADWVQTLKDSRRRAAPDRNRRRAQSAVRERADTRRQSPSAAGTA